MSSLLLQRPNMLIKLMGKPHTPDASHEGSFSFPNVPPRAELEYDLELLDFDPADEVLRLHRPCQ